MSDATATDTTPAIEQGTYEVIRDRLIGHGRELARRAEALNAQRLELFGGEQTAVVGNERIRTENNCVARDILAVGDCLLFGYNVFIGLKRETTVSDVFTLRRFRRENGDISFEKVADDDRANFLADKRFLDEFRNLCQYYRQARLLSLRRLGDKILAIFQVGQSLVDLKGFRWVISVDGTVTYLDNQGDRDHVFPPSHDFEWTATTRDDHVSGTHPHVSILDAVFVETVGGDLTVKVEDNTEDGLGIYREPVDDANQALDDAQVLYARLGSLILIKVLPFHEERWRYLVYNTLTRRVSRIDNIGHACVQLPENHGVIFPGGYYLQRGETKTFAADITDMEFERAVRSANGEDVLYVFQRQVDGEYVLLPYNVIRKEVDTPIHCHGYCLFDDGKMIVFRSAGGEPTRVHAMQIWQTPFVSDEFAAAAPTGDSYLESVGNADLVRGISDSLSIRRMTEEQSPTRAMYEELIAACSRVTDLHHWLGSAQVGDLRAAVNEVHAAAELIIDEFEKVQQLQREAREATADAEAALEEMFGSLRPDSWKSIDEYVAALAGLRRERGRLITLRDMRYVVGARIDELEAQVVEQYERIGGRAVEFLLEPEALAPYHAQVAGVEGQIPEMGKTADLQPLREELEGIGDGLDLLTEVVGNLEIGDATVRTRILESISEVMASLNRTRALAIARRKELMSKEGVAEFAAQFTLFGQAVTSALNLADTPEKCDVQLSRLMLQLEEVEGRFSEFDEFLEQLETKREEVYEALEGRKQMLLDRRQRRAHNLMQAVERIVTGVTRRAVGMSEVEELNAYFASDAMVLKIRDIARQLRELDDSVRADEAESRLKTAREEALRAMRDRKDIFEEGATVIRLGKHRFSVNTQELDLTLVPHGDGLALHMTGTDFHEPLDDPEFEATRPFWDQQMVSETRDVYRGEYLAYCMVAAAEHNQRGLDLTRLTEAALDDAMLLERVREFAAERYDEGYERGVHDTDAALILRSVMSMYATAGLLRFAPTARAAAALFWAEWRDEAERGRMARRAASLFRLRSAFTRSAAIDALEEEFATLIAAFHEEHRLVLSAGEARIAGRYLFEELGATPERFVVSGEAAALRDGFVAHLDNSTSRSVFEADLSSQDGRVPERHALAEAWLTAWVDATPEAADSRPALPEAIVLLLTADSLPREVRTSHPAHEVTGLLGQHGRIRGRNMTLRLDEFLGRLSRFAHQRVPAYREYQRRRSELLARERDRLRISEFMPRVMSAFVRNKLINEVYLPLIGDNLAKQLGARGEGKRTDLMGLLMLISPPGYGKTTLMEYIANRLGLVFMKVNGPALGHGVTSLDPLDAPNATARQEVEKMNLAFEMGNNVLLYLDDIQHTSSELLQKFISLCDAQRKVEGVWRGRTRTYDLRGKKFIVCMAGNPYTESGERFQVPDMLANRADVYNLGDVLSGKDDLFALSYVENSLTSSSSLAPVTTFGHDDIYTLVRMAQGEELPASKLSHDYSQVQLQEMLAVLRKLLRVQQVLLAVNQEYIRSASTDDDYRTEPPFQLQGSYRNMNKLAEKVVPVMNDEELERLLDDHYVGEAQTLTSGAEQNMLKLAELRGTLTDAQAARWAEIKQVFARRQMLGGDEDDPATRVSSQLISVSDRLDTIGDSIRDAVTAARERDREWETAIVARRDEAAARDEVLRKTLAASHEANDGGGAELAQALVPYLEGLQGNLAALSAAAAAAPAVGESLDGGEADGPDVRALALRQAEVIEVGLLPILRSLNHNLTVSKAVWERMDDIAGSMQRLAGARPRKPAAKKKTARKASPKKPKPKPAT